MLITFLTCIHRRHGGADKGITRKCDNQNVLVMTISFRQTFSTGCQETWFNPRTI